MDVVCCYYVFAHWRTRSLLSFLFSKSRLVFYEILSRKTRVDENSDRKKQQILKIQMVGAIVLSPNGHITLAQFTNYGY